MTNTPPPEILKHCLAVPCRRETRHVLAGTLGGRALYQCAEPCGSRPREVTDPGGSTDAARRIETARVRAEKALWRKESDDDAKKETKRMKTNPLQDAITAEVKNQLRGLARKEDLEKLEEKVEELEGKTQDGVNMIEVEKKIVAVLEEQLPDMLQRSLLQMLAKPKAARGGAGDGEGAAEGCRHKNFMRKCKSCQARHADEG